MKMYIGWLNSCYMSSYEDKIRKSFKIKYKFIFLSDITILKIIPHYKMTEVRRRIWKRYAFFFCVKEYDLSILDLEINFNEVILSSGGIWLREVRPQSELLKG